MLKFTLVMLGIILIYGCASKEKKALMKEYASKKSYYKKLQKTEKILLTENNVTKAVLTANYLYEPTLKRRTSKLDERFIIGLYMEDEEVASLSDIWGVLKDSDAKKTEENKTKVLTKEKNETIEDAYELTLNGKKPLSIEKIALDDSRLKGLSFVTEWNTYALVTFKHIKGNHLNLHFKSKKYGKGNATFSKVAKYVFTRESI